MINIRNKNIIVTGASGGIGNSIVKKLIEYKVPKREIPKIISNRKSN